MRKILLSLVTILAIGSMTTLATRAAFSSTATVQNNTFATGVLDIRVNNLPIVQGFNFTGAAPGDSVTHVFTLMNYGSPYFAGPSTLAAKELATDTQ
ncbi:MAG TPA: TasA family protein, partial [Patescibacteria group bacterium]|nr:TasA family protein [Patescibacteria group bacterium]